MTTNDNALARTRAWVDRAVIGLNLCPFAKAPQAKGLVRYALSEARDTEALLANLVEELERLAESSPEQIETTLLVHPWVLQDFLDFNDFLDVADAAVAHLGLDGILQVAPFHPQFQFADSAPGDPGNATNQAPFPTLHLLREESIDRAVQAFPDAGAIFQANIATLQQLGADGWAQLLRQCEQDADPPAPPPA